jgi:hypothetical protein
MDTVLQVLFVSGSIILGFFLIAGFLWYRTRRYIKRSHKAIGVVIKVKKIPFENRDTFSPVVRFETGDGRALSFTDPVSKYPAEFEVGEQTPVLYDPRNPHKARAVKRISDLFISAQLFGGAGAVLLVLGLLAGMAFGLRNYLSGLF